MAQPISERQLAANRANSLKSTGPTTDAGKRRSARNSTTHGLTAFSIPLAGPDRREYRGLAAEIKRRFIPINALEDSLVRRIVQAHWHIHQAERILEGFYDLCEQPDLSAPKRLTARHRCRRLAARLLEDSTAQKLLNLVLRYQSSARREIASCEKQLEQLRTPKCESKPMDEAEKYLARHMSRQELYRQIRNDARKLAPVFDNSGPPPRAA